MTITAKPEEMREGFSGQRAQEFRHIIPSTSQPDRAYTIAREHTGTIYHIPVCLGWLYRGRCRHVARAVALTDDPLRTLHGDLHAGGSTLADSIREEQLEPWARQVAERVDQALEAFVTRKRWLAREELLAAGKTPVEDIWRRYGDG